MLMPSIFNDNLFDNLFEEFSRPVRRVTTANQLMKTDVRETENSFELDIDLPGFKKEDVKAQLKDGYMTIRAESKKETDDKDDKGTYIRRERFYGTTERSFYVGEQVKEEDIKARFEDGILKISIPKKPAVPEVQEEKYIAIE
ncbi:MAG: Hsp20/alpha crystallin family protein [Lachnospiraceae bacterium]|nr:Hsp20/alpha crystallin family protein [Lachnospiraceae bacterium]